MSSDLKTTAEQCQRLLDVMDNSEQIFVALKDLDPTESSAADGILKELREMKLHVRRAHTLFNTLPDALNDIQQAILLTNRAKDFIDTMRKRRNDTDCK